MAHIGKTLFFAGLGNKRINDGHAQREREASQALHRMWEHAGRPTNMASSWDRFAYRYVKTGGIDSDSLEPLAINREICIPNREIGRSSLFYQKSGDLPLNRETWKLW